MKDLHRIDLAHQPDFALGGVAVSPSRRELIRPGGVHEVLEHRVMQVLVALVEADGTIVTRDELVQMCWDGRIVGDDAINRVISRLRKSAAGIGAGAFHIETLSKVGYRLIVEGAREPSIEAAGEFGASLIPEADQGRSSRRVFLAGVAAAGTLAVAGGGTWLYRSSQGPDIPPEIQALMTQGRQLLGHRNPYSYFQAIGMYRRVVELAPDYADGWGMLGFAYAVPSHFRPRAEALSLRQRAESAAKRALAIDPGNAYGEIALATALPWIGAWEERSRHIARALADRPDDDVVLVIHASALEFTGRYTEALPLYKKISRPFTPNTYNNYIRALWAVDRVEEMDGAADDAAALYPTFAPIWLTRFHIRAYSGNPDAAIALALDPEGRPTTLAESQLAELLAFAEALRDRDAKQIDKVMTTQMARANDDASSAEVAISNASALGRIDHAFTLAEAYYFGRGFVIPDYTGPDKGFSPEQRQTRLLFEPATKPMRADARFERLVAELGLDRYWRESGVQPDYRRRRA